MTGVEAGDETVAVPAPPPPERDEAAGTPIRAGARAFLALERRDLLWLLALVGVAFALRAASPIFPDWLTHPFQGPAVTAQGLGHPYNGGSCVPDVPVGPGGTSQQRCGFVFDEVYFPVDAAKDLHQPAIAYFDPEPPLAKLLMASPIGAFGFDPWVWRIATALAGSLFVGLVYMVAMRLRRDRFFAVAAALFVCFDGLAFVESRTGVIDMIAILLSFLIVYAFLLHWQARTRRQWRATLYALAVAVGLGFGAKLTALAPLVVAAALIAARYLEPLALRRIGALRRVAGERGGDGPRLWREAGGRLAALHYVAAAAVAALVFGACFSRYLSIDHPVAHVVGCDAFADASRGEQALRVGPTVDERVPTYRVGSLTLPDLSQAAANVIDKLRADLDYHAAECRSHPYQSHWYTWPAMQHPVLFYADCKPDPSCLGQAGEEVSWITNMGNPALWWPAIVALLFCAWRMLPRLRGATPWRSAGFRAAVLGVGALGLALMIVGFNAAERPQPPVPGGTVRVAPGLVFYAGLALTGLFLAAAVVWATVSRRFVPAFIVLGYMAAWLMWFSGNEQRILFFYHMLGALPFMALGLAYALTALRHTRHRIGLDDLLYGGVVVLTGVLAIAAIGLLVSSSVLAAVVVGGVAVAVPVIGVAGLSARAAADRLAAVAVNPAPLAHAGVALVVVAFAFFYPVWTAAGQSASDHLMRIWFSDWL